MVSSHTYETSLLFTSAISSVCYTYITCFLYHTLSVSRFLYHTLSVSHASYITFPLSQFFVSYSSCITWFMYHTIPVSHIFYIKMFPVSHLYSITFFPSISHALSISHASKEHCQNLCTYTNGCFPCLINIAESYLHDIVVSSFWLVISLLLTGTCESRLDTVHS